MFCKLNSRLNKLISMFCLGLPAFLSYPPVFFKEFASLILGSFIRPRKTYEKLNEKPFIYHFGSVYFLLAIILILGCFDPVFVNSMKNGMGIFQSIGLVLMLPCLFFAPVIHVHWAANGMGGSGTITNYYKLIVWSLIPIFVFFVILYYLIILLKLFLPLSVVGLFFVLSTFFVINMFLIISLSVSQKISTIRSIVVYILCVTILFAAIYFLGK